MSGSPRHGGQAEHDPVDAGALSAGDAALGLLALSQMPNRTPAEYRTLLGAETDENLAMVVEAAIGLIGQLLIAVSAARREPVEVFVNRLRQATLRKRDEPGAGS